MTRTPWSGARSRGRRCRCSAGRWERWRSDSASRPRRCGRGSVATGSGRPTAPAATTGATGPSTCSVCSSWRASPPPGSPHRPPPRASRPWSPTRWRGGSARVGPRPTGRTTAGRVAARRLPGEQAADGNSGLGAAPAVLPSDHATSEEGTVEAILSAAGELDATGLVHLYRQTLRRLDFADAWSGVFAPSLRAIGRSLGRGLARHRVGAPRERAPPG